MPEHDDLAPYSPAEAKQIRKMLGASNATVVCPRCRGALKFTAVTTDKPSVAVWELTCGTCHRRLVVGEHADRRVVIEACVESLEAAVAAAEGGAHRIELCVDLAVGGTSPDRELLEACVAKLGIPVFVMVRPRGGDFTYSPSEHAQMLEEIRRAKEIGVRGIVTGSLRRDGSVHEALTGELVAAARPLPVTFHRAFDECHDADAALQTLLALGMSRVLTSGQAPTAPEGAATIARLVRLAAGRIGILAGGGVNADNVAAMVRATGVREVHLSTKDADKIRRVALSLERC